MKLRNLFATLTIAGTTWVMLPWPSLAGLPQPMCVYFGQAKNGYGLPYLHDADVILRHGTNEIARQTIRGSLKPGVNFALYVHLDADKAGQSYSPRALHSGDLVTIVVHDSAGEKTIMESQAVPSVGQPGELILCNVTADQDVNGDGLPDTWEYELIAASGGLLHSLNDVKGEDDFDDDGVSNRDEYLAGTFPFLNYDYLHIEQSALTPNGRVCLTFLTVPGKAYGVQYATNLTQTVWSSAPIAVSDTGPLQLTPAEGDGNWSSLYVPIGEPSGFFRLSVQ